LKLIIATNIKDIVTKMNDQADKVATGTAIQMYQALTILEAAMKQNIRVRSGLHVRSGSLLNSVQKDIQVSGNTVTGRIGPENIPYAAIHEYGGTIPARRIEPRNAKALRWAGSNGQFWFSKGHDMPSVQIPARPYMQPALEEKAEIIREKFKMFIVQTMSK
jgi:phage gpG-like protein